MRRFLFITFLLSSSLFAQNDFGIWGGVDARYSFTKKLAFGLEYQWRFDNNVSRLNNTFLSPYASYRIKKFLEVGVSYRWTNETEGRGYFGSQNVHRITVDIEAKNLQEFLVKDSRFDLGFRLRGTHETDIGDLNSDYLRGQLELKYNVKGIKLEPFISFEGFLHFNDQLIYSSESVRAVHRVNKLRYRVGCKYEIIKNQELSMFYMIQDEMESMKNDFVLGLGYSFKFKQD